MTFARAVSGEWVTRKAAGSQVTRDEWKRNTVSVNVELSPFLLLPVMISSSTSNLRKKKDIYWAINENQYIS